MKYIHSIINRLKPAKGLYLNKLEMKDEINGIMEMLKTLVDNTRLERMLWKRLAPRYWHWFQGHITC